jgi:hypothetical protein
MDARAVIPAFDAFLQERRLTLRATVIGGAALQLLGIIARATKDCDVLDPTLPVEIIRAADEFPGSLASAELRPGWLNNGPASLIRTLPVGWAARSQPLYSGSALELLTLAREDLLRSKLFALVDRNIDLADCVALRPTRDELGAILPWLDEQDGNEQWPEYVRIVLAQLAKELGHEP